MSNLQVRQLNELRASVKEFLDDNFTRHQMRDGTLRPGIHEEDSPTDCAQCRLEDALR